MTDRYALDYAAGSLMARIKDSTVEAVRQSADFVAVVEERTPLRKSGARLVGRCPFHEERTPSFSVNPVDKLYYCHGCHKGGDMIGFVRDTQGARLRRGDRVARAARSGSPPSTRRPRRRRTHAAAAASGCWRCSTTPPSSTSATSGSRRPARSRATTSPGAASASRSAASSGSVSPSAAAAHRARRSREGLHAPRSSGRPAWPAHDGGDYFERRLVFPLTDARGRVLGFQARRLHDDDPLQAKYVNTAESELFTKGAVVYGLDKARAGDRARGPRLHRRGQHRRDRAPPGRVRAGRRVHGDGADRAAAARARPADEAALARVRRRCGRRVGGAPGNGARSRAGLRREGRRAAGRHRPGRRPGRVRGEARRRRCPTSSTAPRSRRSGADDREAGRRAVEAFLRPCPTRSTAGPPGAGRTTSSGCRSRSAAAGRRRRGRALAASRRRRRPARAGRARRRRRPPEPRADPRRDHAGALPGRDEPRAARPPRRRRAAEPECSRSSPSSTRWAPRGGDRQADRRGVPAAAPRARALGGAAPARRTDEGAPRPARPDPAGCPGSRKRLRRSSGGPGFGARSPRARGSSWGTEGIARPLLVRDSRVRRWLTLLVFLCALSVGAASAGKMSPLTGVYRTAIKSRNAA